MVKQGKRVMISSSNLPCVLRLGEGSTGEMPHVDFANLRLDPPDMKAVAHFRNQCDRWLPKFLFPDEDREDLDFGEYLEQVLPRQEWLRDAWKSDDPVALEYLRKAGADEMEARWEFREGRVELTPRYLWNAICVLFLHDHAERRTGVCANPDCPAPFFIKSRRSQTLCGNGACKRFALRKASNKWWGIKGNEWRAQRNKQASRKRSRRP